MKVAVVDANVILRFLTNDVLVQANKVRERFKEAARGKIDLAILPITVVEIVFLLEHWYQYGRGEICDKLLLLFAPEWMNLQSKAAVFEALRVYKERNIDFVDVLLWGIARDEQRAVLSFDKDFDKLDPKIRLEP